VTDAIGSYGWIICKQTWTEYDRGVLLVASCDVHSALRSITYYIGLLSVFILNQITLLEADVVF
jgi:hypothetical protein